MDGACDIEAVHLALFWLISIFLASGSAHPSLFEDFSSETEKSPPIHVSPERGPRTSPV